MEKQCIGSIFSPIQRFFRKLACKITFLPLFHRALAKVSRAGQTLILRQASFILPLILPSNAKVPQPFLLTKFTLRSMNVYSIPYSFIHSPKTDFSSAKVRISVVPEPCRKQPQKSLFHTLVRENFFPGQKNIFSQSPQIRRLNFSSCNERPILSQTAYFA